MALEQKNVEKSEKLETLKVLVADDDIPTRILLRAAIAKWGFEVIEAKDGEEAWNILQQPNAPKLLILDWLMPKLDGIALCSRIKQELTHLPYIILLTQVSGTTNIIKALDSGANEFLSKPFNMAELRSRLSVGARIIQYENMLAKQNDQLQDYVKKIEMLGELELEMLKKLDDILETSAALEKNSQSIALFEQIQELHKSLLNVIEATKRFRK